MSIYVISSTKYFIYNTILYKYLDDSGNRPFHTELGPHTTEKIIE